MKFLRWIKDYWYIPLLGLGAIVVCLFLFLKPSMAKNVLERVRRELAAIQSSRDARDTVIREGHEEALKQVKEKYKAKFEALDAKEKARAIELEHDPVQLAKVLERLSR